MPILFGTGCIPVRSAPADSLSFHKIGKDLYISCSGEAESRIRKPASCFCDLKNVIDRPGPMPLCFAVEKRCSSTFVHESITSSSA